MTVAEKIIEFNKNLSYQDKIGPGFDVLNPFEGNELALAAMEQFYTKFYNDQAKRRLILGINPGRHGAGITGIPFTDTKRLESHAGITMEAHSHEISSVFVYDMIDAYGGVEKFYNDFYINSPFPLALIQEKTPGNWVNLNYYDDKQLYEQLKPFMLESLQKHIDIGIEQDVVFIMGKKNAQFIKPIIQENQLFDRIEILDHPRYIQQYKMKQKPEYIAQYLDSFNKIKGPRFKD